MSINKPVYINPAQGYNELLTTDLKADGTVALTADWNVGAFDLTCVDMTATGNMTANNVTASPTLGAEINTGFASWTAAAGWSYGGGKWTHASGTTALSDNQSAVFNNGTTYKIVIGYTWAGAGSTIRFSAGGQSFPIIDSAAASSITYYIKAANTTSFAATPTTGFTGSIDSVSIKTVTQGNILSGDAMVASGQILAPPGNSDYPGLAFQSHPDRGVWVNYEGRVFIGLSSMYAELYSASASFILRSNSANLGVGINGDLVLRRADAAQLQLGSNSATPTDQTFKACGGSGTDKNGAMMTIQGGQSTGTALPGGVRIQTSTIAGTGSTENTYYDRLRVVGKVYSLTNNSTTNAFSVACADGNGVGGKIDYTVTVRDGTDVQTEAGVITFAAVNKAAETWTTDIDVGTVSSAKSASTLTVTWALDTATADTLKVTVNSNSGLTPTSTQLRYTITFNSPQVITIL